MGTRSLTRFFDGSDREISRIYIQCDGYPSGHGKALAQWLAPFTIISGIGQDVAQKANGIDCLAAQFVAKFKNGIGGLYVARVPGPDEDIDLEAYNYSIREFKGEINLRVHDYKGDQIFDGSPKEFLKQFIKADERTSD